MDAREERVIREGLEDRGPLRDRHAELALLHGHRERRDLPAADERVDPEPDPGPQLGSTGTFRTGIPVFRTGVSHLSIQSFQYLQISQRLLKAYEYLFRYLEI